MRLPQFAVRPRTLLLTMGAILLVAGAVVAYLTWSGQPEGRVRLREFSKEETATVGLAGSFPGQGEEALANPLGMAWDGKTLYVAESDAGIVRRFDARGGDLGTIGLKPAEGKQSVYPSSLALAQDGRIAIVDSAGPRVVVVSTDAADSAKVLLTLGGSTGPGQPTSVAFSDGEYFVFDAAARGVLVYDREGNLVRTIGADLQPAIAYAAGLCVADGTVFITDTNGGRVVAIDRSSGAQVLVFPDHYSLPRCVVPLQDGYLAVADAFEQAIYITTETGERRDTISAETLPEGALTSPRGAVWVAKGQRLYVTDALSGVVAVYNVRLQK